MIYREGEASMKKPRQSYDLDYKRRIVAEYLSGTISADDLAHRENLVRGQIYKWRVQLERRDRMGRIEAIAETEGVSIEQARRIRELEEELAATQQKLAQTMLENDLLKKLQPNSPFASATSGYIGTKRLLARSRGRAK
jgi:transposase-like protein